MSETNKIVEEEKSWKVWCNDNVDKLKIAGYVLLGLSITSVGGYFAYRHYSNDE